MVSFYSYCMEWVLPLWLSNEVISLFPFHVVLLPERRALNC